MTRLNCGKAILVFASVVAVATVSADNAMAQSGVGNGGSVNARNQNEHVSFDSPEAWALKYFASTTLLSGLQPEQFPSGRRIGSVTVGLELGWLPTLDPGQTRVGFNGTAPEDLNNAPYSQAGCESGLPGKFSVVVAAPPPLRVFGSTPHLLAFGLERPILQREGWTVSWRGYGQVGSVKSAFTCPSTVLAFPPGSPKNPTHCVGESADVASLRYAGSEMQFAYRLRTCRSSFPMWPQVEISSMAPSTSMPHCKAG